MWMGMGTFLVSVAEDKEKKEYRNLLERWLKDNVCVLMWRQAIPMTDNA